MSGEIWRYHSGQWSRVHKATTFTTPYGTYPEGIGYRIMTTFEGAIYARAAGSLFVGTANSFEGCEIWKHELRPVDGIWTPINKFELLAPWIGSAALITVATVSVVYVKHRRKQQD